MIPYLLPPELPWLPLTVFSFLVLSGCIVGSLWGVAYGRRHGLRTVEVLEMAIWVVIPAYLGSHVFMALAYYPQKVVSDPMFLLRFNEGLSAFGGLLCGVVAFYLHMRMSRNMQRWRVFGDTLIYGFVVGWIFGRAGCSIVHDHPGISSDFLLAVQYPGGSRHDLGLYELLYTICVLVPVSLWVERRGLPPGSQILAFCLLYGLFRFPADFLRLSDTTYLGLTPAQYGSFVLWYAAWWMWRGLRVQRENAGI